MASSTFEQVKSDAKQGGLGMVGKKYETVEIITVAAKESGEGVESLAAKSC